MKYHDLDAMLAVAQEAVDIGRKLMLTQGPGEVHTKGDRDLVTDLDLRIQHEVRAFLNRATPHVQFLGEEEGGGSIDPGVDYVWALDPIDGTSNFAHGIPLCASQLALVQQGEPVVGVIVAPFLDLSYHAIKDSGAYCNGRRIHASTNGALQRAIVSIGDYATGFGATEKNEKRFSATRTLAKNVERVRMLGSAALDLSFTADGRLDTSVILSNKPWDIAAGVVLAREAGASTLDAGGSAYSINSSTILVGNKKIAPRIAQLLTEKTLE